MTELTPQATDDAARAVVEDYLDAELEYLTVAEYLDELFPDADPDDLLAVYEAATILLRNLRETF